MPRSVAMRNQPIHGQASAHAGTVRGMARSALPGLTMAGQMLLDGLQ